MYKLSALVISRFKLFFKTVYFPTQSCKLQNKFTLCHLCSAEVWVTSHVCYLKSVFSHFCLFSLCFVTKYNWSILLNVSNAHSKCPFVPACVIIVFKPYVQVWWLFENGNLGTLKKCSFHRPYAIWRDTYIITFVNCLQFSVVACYWFHITNLFCFHKLCTYEEIQV